MCPLLLENMSLKFRTSVWPWPQYDNYILIVNLCLGKIVFTLWHRHTKFGAWLYHNKIACFICLFVWGGCSSHSRIFHSYGDVIVTGVRLCSALMAIEQWGFFSVPHLMGDGASVYNGHLGGPVTLATLAEHIAVELSLLVFTT